MYNLSLTQQQQDVDDVHPKSKSSIATSKPIIHTEENQNHQDKGTNQGTVSRTL